MTSVYLCFGLIICLSCINAEIIRPDHGHSNHWDLLIYTQHWPITVCREWKEKNEAHTCQLPKLQDSWTVHGIWPSNFTNMGPQNCNRSWPFDPEEIRAIEPVLTQLWTNIEGDTSTYSFWAHEWTKHGTCAASIEPLNTQLKYFGHGLEWLKNYSMLDILNDAGIVPSNTEEYQLTDINAAVKQRIGFTPIIECRKEEGNSYLFEIRICFNKQLELESCEYSYLAKSFLDFDLDDAQILTNCDASMGIIYPRDVKPAKSILVELYRLVLWLQWLTW